MRRKSRRTPFYLTSQKRSKGNQLFIATYRLKNTFGIYGTALAWISSYLKDRSFRMSVGDATSSSQDLRYGIPQGSVVGPLFFVLCTCCIGTIIRKYNIHYHMYADDVQLYLPFNAKSIRFAIDKLSSCINEISEWMTMNKLKLNGEKKLNSF